MCRSIDLRLWLIGPSDESDYLVDVGDGFLKRDGCGYQKLTGEVTRGRGVDNP